MNKKLLFILVPLFLSISGFTQEQKVTILHTNDTHSQIDPFESKETGEVGGVLRRYEVIKEMKKTDSQLLLLDAGDFSQGTPYFNFFKGYAEIKLMNMMGYDAATLGNHEFDNGVKELTKRVKKADFDIVCANYIFKNRTLSRIVKPYKIYVRNGLRIGVFGLGTDLTGLVSLETAGIVSYRNAIEVAKKIVPHLRNNEHCDLIICISHLGFASTDSGNPACDTVLAKEVGDIDLIIGGHTHTWLEEPYIINGVRIVQLGNKGKHIGIITIEKKVEDE